MAAFALSNWFYGRAKDATHTLEADPKPSPEEAAAIRGRMIGLAFLVSGIVLGLFLILAWLF